RGVRPGAMDAPRRRAATPVAVLLVALALVPAWPASRDATASPGTILPPAEVARQLGAPRRERWFGLYFGGRKVGWQRWELRPAAPGESGAVVAVSEASVSQGNREVVRTT